MLRVSWVFLKEIGVKLYQINSFDQFVPTNISFRRKCGFPPSIFTRLTFGVQSPVNYIDKLKNLIGSDTFWESSDVISIAQRCPSGGGGGDWLRLRGRIALEIHTKQVTVLRKWSANQGRSDMKRRIRAWPDDTDFKSGKVSFIHFSKSLCWRCHHGTLCWLG